MRDSFQISEFRLKEILSDLNSLATGKLETYFFPFLALFLLGGFSCVCTCVCKSQEAHEIDFAIPIPLYLKKQASGVLLSCLKNTNHAIANPAF